MIKERYSLTFASSCMGNELIWAEVSKVRKKIPQVLVIKSVRLGPHSKGDDTRNAKELKKLNDLDPLIKLRKKIKNSNLLEKTEKKAEQYILRLFDYSIKNKFSNKKKISKQDSINIIKLVFKNLRIKISLYW